MGIVTQQEFDKLEQRLREVEVRFGNMLYDARGVVQSELKDRMVVHQQSESQFGLYTALCIDTIDIWKQNRIRFFCPAFHNPKRPIKEMPWAYPVSSLGGFDDCGVSWVPPAGSTVCILFEAGQRSSPFYIGTTWHRNRGPGGNLFGFNIDEYYRVWSGHRGGYMVGPDDESQVFPPWNTENYNGFDLSSIVDFSSNPEAQKLITYPNIYGFKTPEKHMIKMVDGDPKCNRRWKRFEIMSGCGNWIMLKDDHLHYAGQWANPQCGGVRDGETSCVQGASNSAETDITKFQGLSPDGTTAHDAQIPSIDPISNAFADVINSAPNLNTTKTEDTPCQGTHSNSKIIGGHPATSAPDSPYIDSQSGANPFFKHRSECRPYQGPGTPQNNKIDLPQSGIQIMSISGHTIVLDDSVEEPSGDPRWERGMQAFDFGCNNHYSGRTYWKSATGHCVEMRDVEAPPTQKDALLRGENNFIRLLTATGNKIELNDHTVGAPDCPGCPPNVAGDMRGIKLSSTAGHTIEMHDEGNQQCGPCRMEGGIPAPMANPGNAFVKIRTGYGLEMMYHDDNRQDKTVKQYIQIFCPQKDNKKRGPHIERFQEVPSGPGLIFLRAGGNYVIMTYDNMIEIVGDEKENPSDKIEFITKLKLVYTKDYYINVTEKSHVFLAKEKILLMAGCDCTSPFNPICGSSCGPCVGPVLVYVGGCIRLSDRVFGSSSLNAPGASIFMLEPLVKCPQGGGCS